MIARRALLLTALFAAPAALARSQPDMPDIRAIERRRLLPQAEALLAAERSEEHTSELQSLMRISSAVCCLNKKTKTYQSLVHRTDIRTTTTHNESTNSIPIVNKVQQ